MSVQATSTASSRFFLCLHSLQHPTICYHSLASAKNKFLNHGHNPRVPLESRRYFSIGQISLTNSQSNPSTYYDLFPNTAPAGPPPKGSFIIDLPKLKREFLQLQSRVHPDRFPTGPDKAKAEGASANINEAYKTLQNPLLRAQYLLGLRGIDVAEDETAKTEDPDLLVKVMEVREAAEDAQHESDLESLKTDNDERIKIEGKVIAEAMEKDDMQTAKEAAVRLRYWVNIKGSLDAWEEGKPIVMHH